MAIPIIDVFLIGSPRFLAGPRGRCDRLLAYNEHFLDVWNQVCSYLASDRLKGESIIVDMGVNICRGSFFAITQNA
jgi:hypothetical protein